MLSEYDDIPFPRSQLVCTCSLQYGTGCGEPDSKALASPRKDPNQWVNLYNYLQSNKTRNGRYKQAVQYVTRIRAYLEHIKNGTNAN